MRGLELVILGSGTVVPSLERASSGYLISTPAERLLLDAGSGVLRRMLEVGKEPWKLDRICLSHVHPDHTADLVPLLFAFNYATGPWPRTAPLTLYGPTGVEDFLARLTAAFPWIAPKAYELTVVELEDQPVRGPDWTLTPFRTVHGGLESRAFRIHSGAATLCYSGDTRDCTDLEQAARGVDLLLCEASLPRGYPQVGDHMTSDQAGELARRAGVGRLVLTHLYPLPPDIDLVAEAGEHFDGPVELARDGGVYHLVAGPQPTFPKG